MHPRNVLLGFDAREPGGGGEWNEERRSRYLLRLDVMRPVSIDQMVWRPAVALHGSSGRFWEDLARLRDVVRDAQERPWLVALGVSLGACSPKEKAAVEPFVPASQPDTVEERWPFLGYDVADLGGSFSGLMNCGFLPGHDDVEALRAAWKPKLNSWHLFGDFADAVEFKEFSNRRVREHAPFFVNGIWLIEPESALPTSP